MTGESGRPAIRIAGTGDAAGLYERMGFTVEGRRAQCLLLDGEFVDELYMALILDGPCRAQAPGRQ